jgi:hypothetical protein
VIESTAKCMNETADNPTAQKGCGCVDGEGKINCFAEACWNRVRPLYPSVPISLDFGNSTSFSKHVSTKRIDLWL